MNTIYEKKYYTVYEITNLVNGKVYIGFHSTDNLDDDYMGSGKLIERAIKKHGLENFSKSYLAIFDNRKDAEDLERELVNKEFVEREDTYNLSIGGNVCILFGESNGFFGKKHSKETIERIQAKLDTQREEMARKTSEGLKAFYASNCERAIELKEGASKRMYSLVIPASKTPEARAKQSASLTGREFSEDHRNRISISKTGKKVFRSEEHNRKISEANKGKPRDYVAEKVNRNPEKIRKTAEKHRGMKRSKEACENISLSLCKHLYHTPHGVFRSEKEFSEATGYSGTMLRNRCIVNNDTPLKSASLNRAMDLQPEQKILHIGKTWKEMGWFVTPYKAEASYG